MAQMTLLERIERLFQALVSSPLLILLSLGVVAIFSYFLFQKEKNVRTKQNILLFYIMLVVILLLQYFNPIATMLENMIKDMLSLYYFPSISIIILAFLLLNGSALYHYIKKKDMVKLQSKILILASAFSWILLFSFLASASGAGMDLKNATAIYTNETTFAIVELFMNLIFVTFLATVITSIYGSVLGSETDPVVARDAIMEAVEVKEQDIPVRNTSRATHKLPKISMGNALKNVFSYTSEEKKHGSISMLEPVTNLNQAMSNYSKVEVEDTVVAPSIVTIPTPEPVIPIYEEKPVVSTLEPTRVMQQGIPIIMNLNDYYTQDPLSELEIEAEKELMNPISSFKEKTSKFIPVVEKKIEPSYSNIEPVVSQQMMTQRKIEEIKTVTAERTKEPVVTELEPSLFDMMFRQSSFHKNEEIVQLKQQYNAIDEEMNKLENKETSYKEVSN